MLANPSPTCFTYQARAATSGHSVVPCFIPCGERPGRQMDATLSPVLTVSPAFHVWGSPALQQSMVAALGKGRHCAALAGHRATSVPFRVPSQPQTAAKHRRFCGLGFTTPSSLSAEWARAIRLSRRKAALAQLHKPIPDALEGARGTPGMGDAASPEKGGKRHRTGPMLRRGIRRWARARDSRHE